MPTYYLLLLLLFARTACHSQHNKDASIDWAFGNEKNNFKTTYYKVIGIKDGDTFVLLIGGKEQNVRLAHIDCPEKNQPFGKKAKQYASNLCFGKKVSILGKNRYDRNKRLIAELILPDGRNINKEMVKAGLAWHFKKYSKDETYARLELEARKKLTAIWGDKNPVAPWDWRHKKSKTN